MSLSAIFSLSGETSNFVLFTNTALTCVVLGVAKWSIFAQFSLFRPVFSWLKSNSIISSQISFISFFFGQKFRLENLKLGQFHRYPGESGKKSLLFGIFLIKSKLLFPNLSLIFKWKGLQNTIDRIRVKNRDKIAKNGKNTARTTDCYRSSCDRKRRISQQLEVLEKPRVHFWKAEKKFIPPVSKLSEYAQPIRSSAKVLKLKSEKKISKIFEYHRSKVVCPRNFSSFGQGLNTKYHTLNSPRLTRER